MNHYETLGVEPDATPDAIKAAWRRASSAAHPDRNTDGDATERMQAINNAYEVLSDPERRARYDETGTDSRGPSLKQEATGILVRFFGDALRNSAPIVPFVERVVANLEEETQLAIGEYAARLERTRRRGATVKHTGQDNLFAALVERQVGELEANIANAEKLLQATAIVKAMIAEYSSTDVPPPQSSPAYGSDASLWLPMGSLNQQTPFGSR